MDWKTERAILRHIEHKWRSLGDPRPWGVWVVRHAPVHEDVGEFEYAAMPALRVWFLEERGMQPRSHWEFRRFFVVHFLQPWCKRQFREQDGIFGERQYPIGMVSYAEYTGGKYFLLEMNYGKLFGRGYRLTISGKGTVSEVELWRS